MINDLFTSPLIFFIKLFALLVAISIHEFSHAWMADYLGDPTPRLAGRLKLDPRVHIDSIGMLMLLFVGFGWGKPVEFDPYNLKNPRKDTALISLAGPGSNFILAIILSIMLKVFTLFDLNLITTISLYVILPLIQMNLILGIFNLIPVHPLDGFKIVGGILSEEKSKEWYSLSRYGWLFLIALIIPFGGSSLLTSILSPILNFFYKLLIL